jgi:hypothetical protein
MRRPQARGGGRGSFRVLLLLPLLLVPLLLLPSAALIVPVAGALSPVALFPGSTGAAGASGRYHDGPPARVTGGFGEDSCAACHFEWEENTGTGELRLIGLPDELIPGARVPLTVELVHAGMARAGFQMAIRWADSGAQAGELRPDPDDAHRVARLEAREIQFVHHRVDGTALVVPDTARWRVEWVVPAPPPGATPLGLTLNLSTVAADGDESQMGDHVYTVERSGLVLRRGDAGHSPAGRQ